MSWVYEKYNLELNDMQNSYTNNIIEILINIDLSRVHAKDYNLHQFIDN